MNASRTSSHADSAACEIEMMSKASQSFAAAGGDERATDAAFEEAVRIPDGDEEPATPAPAAELSQTMGLGLVACSALVTSMQNVTLRKTTEGGMPSTQVAFIRAVVQFAATAAWICHRNQTMLGPPGLRWWLALRGILGGVGMLSLFHSVEVLPIGDATALFSLHPIVAAVIAWATIGDQITIGIGFAAVCSVAGVIFVSQPSFLFGDSSENATSSSSSGSGNTSLLYSETSGVVAALATSLCAGAVMVLIRFTKRASTAQQLIPWCIAVLVTSLGMGLTLTPFVTPDAASIPWCAACVVSGLVAHVLMTAGTRASSPALSSVMRSTEILWSYLSQVVIFKETPSSLTLVGVGINVFSLILGAIESEKTRRKTNSFRRQREADDAAARAADYSLVGDGEDAAVEEDEDAVAESRRGSRAGSVYVEEMSPVDTEQPELQASLVSSSPASRVSSPRY